MKTLVKSKVVVPELVEKRRAQLIKAALELFGRQGYHSTTIREIAECANVSIGLIYQYVEDKEDILFLALMAVLGSYQRRIPAAVKDAADPLDKLWRAIGAYCGVNDEMSDATVLAYRETKSLGRERREIIKQKEIETNQLIAECIDDCISAGLFAKTDVDLLTHQLVIFSHAWALKAWRLKRLMKVDDYVDGGLKIILGGVLTPLGREHFDRRTGQRKSPGSRSRSQRRI